MVLNRDDKLILWFLAGTIVLMNIPYGSYALYPFKLFATWIHESFHGLAAVVTGGSVVSIDINPDTSGLTRSLIPQSMFASALVSSMGYLGTAVTGAILLAVRRHARVQRWALFVIGLGAVLSLVFWVRNLFGIVTVASLALLIWLLALRASDHWSAIATNVLASQACVNALLDIRVLYSSSVGHSDAAAMAQTVGLWSWFWATLWLVISALLFWFAWSRSLRAEKAAPAPVRS